MKMITKAQTLQAGEVLDTIRRIKGDNYACMVRHNAIWMAMGEKIRCAPRPTPVEKTLHEELKRTITALSLILGVNMQAPDFAKDLSTVVHTLGVQA